MPYYYLTIVLFDSLILKDSGSVHSVGAYECMNVNQRPTTIIQGQKQGMRLLCLVRSQLSKTYFQRMYELLSKQYSFLSFQFWVKTTVKVSL